MTEKTNEIRMTEKEWRDLALLANKARYDSTTSEKSADVLLGVMIYASRMGGC